MPDYEIRPRTSTFKKYVTRWYVFDGTRQVTVGFETREAAQRWFDTHLAWLDRNDRPAWLGQ